MSKLEKLLSQAQEHLEDNTVRGRMRGGAGNGAAAPATSEPDAADQIRSLAQLRDDGLLSEEEFQAKKAQLLGLRSGRQSLYVSGSADEPSGRWSVTW